MFCWVCAHFTRRYDPAGAWWRCAHCGFIDAPDEHAAHDWPHRARAA